MALQALIASEAAKLTCEYALYYRPRGGHGICEQNCETFASASIIKIPILFAWAYLESKGEVSRDEMCELDAEPQVGGSGLARLLYNRRLPFHDVILLMMALSDNLCTNLVIRRVGLARLSEVISGPLGLQGTRLERKLMDFEARERGLNNWVTAADCVHLYALRDRLGPAERSWVEASLLACVDGGLWLRNTTRDEVLFYHKTGDMPGVLHDWGYTDRADLFLLTQGVKEPAEVYRLLDVLGPLLLA